MEQRRLRVGDILDDYCPRERRVTDHAVVAMIEDEIKQTRCTTCDAEHVYKAARVPPKRKKKDAPAQLYDQVLSAMPEPAARPVAVPHVVPAPSNGSDQHRDGQVTRPGQLAASAAPAVPASPSNGPAPAVPVLVIPEPRPAEIVEQPTLSSPPSEPPKDDGPVHRPLIRATLPRADRQAVARPTPQFTMRQPQGRGDKFRDTPGRAPRKPRAPGGQPPRFNGGAGRGASSPTNRMQD